MTSASARTVTAHYGDPCRHCGTDHDQVSAGPCPARLGNEVGRRVNYVMSQDDFEGVSGAVQRARSTPLIALNAGMPMSPQEAANEAWCALGKRLGFDGMTVEPGDGPFSFTAIAVSTRSGGGK